MVGVTPLSRTYLVLPLVPTLIQVICVTALLLPELVIMTVGLGRGCAY